MVKTRMGLLDLRVQTAKVNNTLRGARVVNVYDAHNGRTYVLKLSVPPQRHNKNNNSDDPTASSTSVASASTATSASSSRHSSWENKLLLIESGVRIHMTDYDREKDLPSGFCVKLRKHIRTSRLEAVHQLGNGGDRIIDLVFSGNGLAVCAHLIIEAFSGGNVILTDADYTILALLRSYRLNDAPATNTGAPVNLDDTNKAVRNDSTRVAVRERYPVDNARKYTEIKLETFIDAGKKALAAVPSADTLAKATGRAARRKLYSRGIAKKALAVQLALEPTLLEHALLTAEYPSETQLEELCKNDCAGLRAVYETLTRVQMELEQQMRLGEMKGYILSTVTTGANKTTERYDEFSPYLFAQYRDKKVREFASFDEAADEFFARSESERVEVAQAKREAAAFKKVDKLETELNGHVTAFESAREKSSEMAQAIESNITEVEAAIMVVRSAIAAAVPWDGLAKMVQDEKVNGNPVAEIIHSLQLDKNQMTLMLEDTFGLDDAVEEEGEDDDEDDEDDDEDDEDEDDDDEDDKDDDVDEDDEGDDNVTETQGKKGKDKSVASKKFMKSSPESRKVFLVPVDISLSAYANARRHYELRKSAAAKMEKAVDVKDRTIKAASKKATNEAHKLEEEAVAASIRARRKALWFEKFNWFISSENFLVVAGRFAQQNDMLVARYLGPADVYVHADVEGASSVIVKNQKRPGAINYSTDIPMLTLEQAGTFAMCRSAAWESNIVTSAWWVRASQVSKTTSTGVYLPPGNFSVRGKKNFLNPTQLVMGLAFLFKVDEASALKHRGERCVRGSEGEGGNMDEATSSVSNGVEISHSALSYTNQDTENKLGESRTKVEGESRPNNLDSEDIDIRPSSSRIERVGSDKGGISSSGFTEIESTVEAAIEDRKDDGDQQSGRRRKSTKEKNVQRSTKHGGSDDHEFSTMVEKNEMKNDGKTRGGNVTGKVEGKPKGGAPLPRGKKHKLKKMKKYSDQDDEERRIALTVLGSKPIKEELDNSEKQGDDNEDSDNLKDQDSIVDKDDGRNNNSKRSPREPKQEEMLLMDEEGVVELERLEADTTAMLNLMTGIPTKDDVIEVAMPVCAPLQAISKYQYRVKLMPGNMKRGKAYRAAVVLFQRQAEKDLSKYKQERDAIRVTPESDGIHSMLGNVKIVAPGLADAQKALSKSKKSSAKSSGKASGQSKKGKNK